MMNVLEVAKLELGRIRSQAELGNEKQELGKDRNEAGAVERRKKVGKNWNVFLWGCSLAAFELIGGVTTLKDLGN